MLLADNAIDLDLSRIIQRAYREAEEEGADYDTATTAAVRAILAVYPDWSRDDAISQIHRLGEG